MWLKQGKDEANKTYLVGNASGYWFFDMFFGILKLSSNNLMEVFCPHFDLPEII
jgi:hypothetical protein